MFPERYDCCSYRVLKLVAPRWTFFVIEPPFYGTGYTRFFLSACVGYEEFPYRRKINGPTNDYIIEARR